MNKNKKINWNDEFAKSIPVLGKALLKGLGWALSILITLGLIAVKLLTLSRNKRTHKA
jgi:hypothetical protein